MSNRFLHLVVPAPGWGVVLSTRMEFLVLDIVYVIAVLAVFALIGLVARGVEKL